jgi:hypothetical protein
MEVGLYECSITVVQIADAQPENIRVEHLIDPPLPA